MAGVQALRLCRWQVTPQHGPSWADDDRAWEAFAPEPKHLAQRPRRSLLRLALELTGWLLLLVVAVLGAAMVGMDLAR